MYRKRLRNILKLLVACAVISFSASENVFAQSSPPGRNRFGSSYRNRPTVSPYLSLVDSGNSTNNGDLGLNYYNIVRPRERARQANQELQKELTQVETDMQGGKTQSINSRELAPITTGRMRPTGHSTSFGDTGGYFPGQGSQRGGGGGGNNQFGRNGNR